MVYFYACEVRNGKNILGHFNGYSQSRRPRPNEELMRAKKRIIGDIRLILQARYPMADLIGVEFCFTKFDPQ